LPTITQLQYIVTVDKLRHFGEAAQACHVSQPSLSMQIMKVEDEIGFPLFDRVKKPIVPTEKGARFIESARAVLREHERMMAHAKKDEKEVSGEFRLGVIPTIAPYLLPLFLEKFSITYPKVKLHVDEMKTESIVAELKKDLLDAAVLATPLNEQGLNEEPMFYEKFYLYVSENHPLSKKTRVKQDDIDGTGIWLIQDGHCLRNQMIRLCSLKNQKGVFKNIYFEGGNLETLRYLVQKGHGYTLIPQLFLNTLSPPERKKYVREFETPSPMREVSLIARRDQWKSDIMRAIFDSITQNLPKDFQTSLAAKEALVVKVV